MEYIIDSNTTKATTILIKTIVVGISPKWYILNPSNKTNIIINDKIEVNINTLY